MNAHRYGAILCCALWLIAANAHAQEYPNKVVRLIVPAPPGGSMDIFARLIGAKLSEAFGQQVISENKAGAGGVLANELVSKAKPDGYTLLFGHLGSLAVSATLYSNLPYDPVNAFQSVSLVATSPSVMAVHPSLPAKTAGEFIALAREKPGKLSYGSAGNGSAAHLICAYLTMMAKIDVLHVPFKGTGPALIDLMAGRVSTVFTGTAGILPHVRSGKLRVIGVSSSKRLKDWPDLPTIAESGLPGYEVIQWWGMVAPAGTPRPIVMKLNEAIAKGLQAADLRQRFAAVDAEPTGSTPEEFHAHIKSEITRWAPVIKTAGMKPD